MTLKINVWDWPAERTKDGYYRFVSHELRLATTGFETLAALYKNADIIRTDAAPLKAMADRYAQLWGDDANR